MPELFISKFNSPQVKKLIGEAGIRHKDQIYQFIANRGKMILYLKVAINVKCLSSVSDG